MSSCVFCCLCQPIPYWLYKLHGLNISYTCEICGNYTYRGPKAFQRHFAVSSKYVCVVLDQRFAASFVRPFRIPSCENGNRPLTKLKICTQKCTQKLKWCSKQTARILRSENGNSVLKKSESCAQNGNSVLRKWQVSPMPWKECFSTTNFHQAILRSTALKSRFHGRGILEGSSCSHTPTILCLKNF